MPKICEFHGIQILIHRQEHAPPHFHAIYGKYELLVRVDIIGRFRGRLPRRAEALVFRWAALHQQELFEDWVLAVQHRPMKLIDPLD
jgi:hypothetical protein